MVYIWTHICTIYLNCNLQETSIRELEIVNIINKFLTRYFITMTSNTRLLDIAWLIRIHRAFMTVQFSWLTKKWTTFVHF